MNTQRQYQRTFIYDTYIIIIIIIIDISSDFKKIREPFYFDIFLFKVYVKFNINLNLKFCEWKESISQFSHLPA